MEESHTKRLQLLLSRLGQAVQTSIASSQEVCACLNELSEAGLRTVLWFEASLAFRDGRSVGAEERTIRFNIDSKQADVAYRIDVGDAALLASLGISPSRHRSSASPSSRDETDDTCDDTT